MEKIGYFLQSCFGIVQCMRNLRLYGLCTVCRLCDMVKQLIRSICFLDTLLQCLLGNTDALMQLMRPLFDIINALVNRFDQLLIPSARLFTSCATMENPAPAPLRGMPQWKHSALGYLSGWRSLQFHYCMP